MAPAGWGQPEPFVEADEGDVGCAAYLLRRCGRIYLGYKLDSHTDSSQSEVNAYQ